MSLYALPAHMNTNLSHGVFEEVMRQKAGHGWSWGLSYGSSVLTHKVHRPSVHRPIDQTVWTLSLELLTDWNCFHWFGVTGSHTAIFLIFFLKISNIYIRKWSLFLSRVHGFHMGCQFAVWVTCCHQGATDERKERGWWVSHGSWPFCWLAGSWEENYWTPACVRMVMEERQEYSRWCHGNRLSSFVYPCISCYCAPHGIHLHKIDSDKKNSIYICRNNRNGFL